MQILKKAYMGKLSIEDDCLAPRPRLKLFFTGKDPFSVATGIEEVFKPYFRISTSKRNEQSFKWDVSGQNQEFMIEYWIKKPFSKYSQMRVDVKFQGYQDKETKKGHCRIEIKSKLIHDFPENWAARGFFFLYTLFFYDKVRREYLSRCRSLTEGLAEIVKDKYGMRPSASAIPDRFPSEEEE